MRTPSFPACRSLLLMTMAGIALLGTAACDGRQPGSESSPGGNVLVRGLSGDPGSLDPHRAEDAFSFDVLRDLYEGLTASAPDGQVVSAAAESWTVSADGRSYRFTLRESAVWSDGTPVLARHFVNGLRRALDPATASGGADLLRPIRNATEILSGQLPPESLGVVARGDYELEIELIRPVAYFPDILSNTVASPLHDAAVVPGYRFADPSSVITNGPFTLAEVRPGSSIRLSKNSRFHAAGNVAYDAVDYQIVSDEMVEYARFRAGELQLTNSAPEQHFRALQADPASGLQYRAALATFYYSFNAVSGPLRDQPQLRHALSLAVDRESITRQVAGAGQEPASSLVPPGVTHFTPAAPAEFSLPHDAKRVRAQALYKDAGYSRQRPLKLRVLYNDNPLVERVTLAIAAGWKEALGIEVELSKLDFRGYLAARADPAQWDVVRVGWSADYNDASSFLDTLVAGSPQNFGQWQDSRYEELLRSAASEPDVQLRRQMLQQAEQLMLEAQPIMPVYFYVLRRLVSPKVIAPAINPLNRTYSRDFRPAQ